MVDEIGFTVGELSARTDKAPWIVARGLANLIEKGLLTVSDGTPEEAVARLRKWVPSRTPTKDTPDAR